VEDRLGGTPPQKEKQEPRSQDAGAPKSTEVVLSSLKALPEKVSSFTGFVSKGRHWPFSFGAFSIFKWVNDILLVTHIKGN
jgi:hypothetical protein